MHKGAAAEAVSDPLGELILVQSALEQPVLLDGASWSYTRLLVVGLGDETRARETLEGIIQQARSGRALRDHGDLLQYAKDRGQQRAKQAEGQQQSESEAAECAQGRPRPAKGS